MLRATLLLLGICTAMEIATQDRTWVIPTTTDPKPGALHVSLNTTSMTNIMNSMVPLVAYFALNNKTFNVNYTKSTTLY